MFDELNMHMVTIHVPQFCIQTVEAVEDAGLNITGRRREVVFYNGRRWASLWFSMLRPEWMKKQEGLAE
jgi:RimJ/RimL family protein N-acetyltransferase